MDDVKRDLPESSAPDGHPTDEASTEATSFGSASKPLVENAQPEAGDIAGRMRTFVASDAAFVEEPKVEVESMPSVDGANGVEDEAMPMPDPAPDSDASTPLMGRPKRQEVPSDAAAASVALVGADAVASGEAVVGAQDLASLPTDTTLAEVAPTEKRRSVLGTIVSVIVGSRWILVIPAVLIAVYAGQVVERDRVTLTGRAALLAEQSWLQPMLDSLYQFGGTAIPIPNSQNWQLFLLSGALLVIGVWPRKLPKEEGPLAYLRNLRARKLEAWLDLILLLVSSGLAAAGIVWIFSTGANGSGTRDATELLNWAVQTWLWPFLQVSTSDLDPTMTLGLSWGALFLIFLVVGIVATFFPGLRSAGPSVFLRELTREQQPKPKKEKPGDQQATTELVASEQVASEQAASEQAASEQMGSEQAASEQVVTEQTVPAAEVKLEEQPAPSQDVDVPATGTSEAIAATSTEASPTSTEVVSTEASPTPIETVASEANPPTEVQPEKKVEKKEKTSRGLVPHRALLFFVPLALSMVCIGAAIPLFIELNKNVDPNSVIANWWVNTGSWFLWIASMLLFGLAFVFWENTTRPPEEGENPNPPGDRFPRWLEWVVLLGLFGVALYFRVKDLDIIPAGLWFDEGQDGVVGRQLVSPNAAHVTFVGDFTQMGALTWYGMGALIKMMGDTVLAVRLMPAVMGALIAPLLYLLGARLYGWRVGLVAGGLIAILSWNITWSRIGMATIPTVAMVVAVYLCIAQALRTGRLGYYALAGVLLGLSLQMYYASKLVPVVLGALLVQRLITERMKLLRSLRVGIIVFAVGALIAFTPVGLFAIQHPEIYNGRTDIVSVFSVMNSPDLNTLKFNLESNFRLHALMFNWQGDGNGRHNLPGTPMLDWVTAALFFAGLASCVLRAWRWQYMFPILWGIGSFVGGAFTLPFEAPQSHRAIEGSVVSALIAGIFIGEACNALFGAAMVARLTAFFRMVFGKARRSKADGGRVVYGPSSVVSRPSSAVPRFWMGLAWAISGAALLTVVWWAGTMNIHKYFVVQAQDLSVVKDMQAPQAEAARQTLHYGQEYDVFVAPLWQGVPQAQYLAPSVQSITWPGLQALPLNPGKSGGAILILDYPSAADVSMIARLYPNAHFSIYTAASSPEPLVLTIKIPDSDIKANRGVLTTLYPDGATRAEPGDMIPDFRYDWSANKEGSGTRRFSTTLKVERFGPYAFDLQSASGDQSAAQLLVDGYEVKPGEPISLATGLHSVVATDTVTSEAGTTQLFWTPPGSPREPVPSAFIFDPTKIEPHGLTGVYRPGTAYDGQVQMAQVDPVISYYFHNTPLPLPFTTDWEGKIYIPEDGQYMFGTEQLTSSQLFIDGELAIDNNTINNKMMKSLQLTKGLHDIRLQYLDAGSASHAYLYWQPPGRPDTIIPAIYLWPKMGQYPDTPGSGQWPTLEDSDGSQTPSDRVTYDPPRPEAGQQGQNQPPAQIAPPAEAQPPEPPAQGKAIEPLFFMGNEGNVPGRPRDGAVDSDGNIYIFTERDSKLHKYDKDGKLVTSWDAQGASGPLNEGSAVVVKDDRVYVLDSASSDLVGFTLDGAPAGSIHMCACFYPRDVELAKDGNFWLTNTGNGQVFKIGVAGNQLAVFGQMGTEPGKFIEPASLWEAPDGALYIADIGNKRVQSFTSDFQPVAEWQIGSSIARDGNRLTGDEKTGNILVTQAADRAVVVYDKDGKELDRWVYRLNGRDLIPAGITALGDNKYLVLYPEHDQAIVFSPVQR